MAPAALTRRITEPVRLGWLVTQDAVHGFVRNDDLRQASSLAFYTTLSLIPAMLLLTYLLGMVTGSSAGAHQKVTDYLARMLPGEADRVLSEVAAITRYPGALGVVNALALAWSVTPLVSALREIIRGIFRERNARSFWLTKLIDLAAGMAALAGLAAIASASVLLHMVNAALARISAPPLSPGLVLPFAVTVVLVLAILHMGAPRGARTGHLLAGALATAFLWFLLRPAFTVFLNVDRGYGLAFGSFKSLFIIVIWVYVSMAVLLLGAEVAAACHRREAVAIHRLMEGKWIAGLPSRRRFLLEVPAGHVFFRQGEEGEAMYHLLSGRVAVRRDGRDLAEVVAGRYFGEMTFLLGERRSATVVALEPCACVVIHARNFNQLLAEFPETVREMLVEMAGRLRDANQRTGDARACEHTEAQA